MAVLLIKDRPYRRGLRGRLSVDMVRAGPLKTDEWVQPPQIRGIGRRLGNLTSSELEAQEYGRWS